MDGVAGKRAITFPPQSPRDDPRRPDTIGELEPSGSLSTQGNARVPRTSGGIRKSPELSKGSQVQIFAARAECRGKSSDAETFTARQIEQVIEKPPD
jgi:hypothetical protein